VPSAVLLRFVCSDETEEAQLGDLARK